MICPFSKYQKTPHFEKTKILASVVVIHYTQTFSLQDALSILDTRKLSAHFILDKKGGIIQLVDTEEKAWHAGESSFRGRKNLNDFSIGIELVNPGFLKDETQWSFGHRNHLGKNWANWPDSQIKSLCTLLTWIKKNHSACADVVGHSDVSPGRKIDPGPTFPWGKVRKHMISQ